jgi:hypothetical protein
MRHDLTPETLDSLIHRLDSLVPATPSWIIHSKTNWSEVWSLAAEIQETFKAVRYPTVELRNRAWERFARIRQRASEAAGEDRKIREFRSIQHQDQILTLVNLSHHKPLVNMVFFWDQTTVEDMKRWGRQLSQAGQMLKEAKHEMLGEHKRQCFDAIAEAREANDAWWSSYKRACASRWEERANRHREFLAKRTERREKIRSNLEENRQRFAKAANALGNCRRQIDDLREKIATAWNDSYRDRAGGWLAEELDREADIERNLSRIQEWIEDDERKLRELD